jgi:hypothetical protein
MESDSPPRQEIKKKVYIKEEGNYNKELFLN